MVHAFARLVWKDLVSEWRAKQFVLASLAFGVLILLLVGMALDGAQRIPSVWSAGLLWLCIFFAVSISLTRFDVKDREHGGLLGLLLAPIDRSVLFYAKWCSTWLFVLIAEFGLLIAFFIILNQPLPAHVVVFAEVFGLGTLALTGMGSFLTSVAANSSMKDVLVPLLMFPIAIPLFLALIQLTEFSFTPVASFPSIWNVVLLCYLVATFVLPWLLYEMLLEV